MNNDARMPSLRDKLISEEEARVEAARAELEAIEKAKERAKKGSRKTKK